MAVSKNLRDGVLTITDGASLTHNEVAGPNTREVNYAQGDLRFTVNKAYIQVLDRGDLDHTRPSNEAPMSGSFGFRYSDRNLCDALRSLGFEYAETISGLTGGSLNSDVAPVKTKIRGSVRVDSTDPNAASYLKLAEGATPAAQGEWAEESGNLLNIYTITDDTTLKVLYNVAGVTTSPVNQILLNRSFEVGTVGGLPTSWVKLGNVNDGSTFQKIAGGKKGGYLGRGVLGGTDTSLEISQTVVQSLTVVDTWTFEVWMKASAAMAATIVLDERDAGGSNYTTSANYSLAANGNWVRYRVAHRILDPLSDRLKVIVNVNDAGNLDIDLCRLGANTSATQTLNLKFEIYDADITPAVMDTVSLTDVMITSVEHGQGDDANVISVNFDCFMEQPIIT